MSLRTWYANWKRRRLYGACLATSPQVISLRYHSVGEPGEVARYLDPGLSVTPARFREHLRILAPRFTFLLPSEIAAFREDGHGGRRGVVVTFDDGYRDNHDAATPILVDEGGRACFYVTTGPLSSGRGLWISELFRLVERLPPGRLELPGHAPFEVAGEPAARVPMRRSLTRWLASIGAEAREAAFDAMAARAGMPRGEGLEDSFVTPEQLRSMRAAGMGIGAHTRSHPHLDRLPAELHADEVSGSRADLERVQRLPGAARGKPVSNLQGALRRVRRRDVPEQGRVWRGYCDALPPR